ncbi:hypothetical protein GCM10022282_12690 [Agromyces indicus]
MDGCDHLVGACRQFCFATEFRDKTLGCTQERFIPCWGRDFLEPSKFGIRNRDHHVHDERMTGSETDDPCVSLTAGVDNFINALKRR